MTYRILSLDGGGPWALLEVKALIQLFDAKTLGHEVLSAFDMVAANSGGSLVLGGLVENLPLSTIANFFLDDSSRKMMFSPSKNLGDRVLHGLSGIGPKYSAEAKLWAIEQILPKSGPSQMAGVAANVSGSGGNPVRLLITSFDYDVTRAVFFRSVKSGGPGWGDGDASTATLAEAIHASTNAPVNYFDAPAAFHTSDRRYWDGGVAGCNNPVLAAVTEAISAQVNSTDIRALSIGTGNLLRPLAGVNDPPNPLFAPRIDSSLIKDITKLASSILDDPPDAASFVAHAMVGGQNGLNPPEQSRIVRLNALISPVQSAAGGWTFPQGMTPANFNYLAALPMDAIEPSQVSAIDDFGNRWIAGAVPNQPIRLDSSTLRTEVGYNIFGDALAAWRRIR